MTMEERSTRIYRQKQMFSRDELVRREGLCIHEEPAYCVAACPLKLDTKAMLAAVAAGDFSKALALYEKVTPLVHLLSGGCEAPCEGKCRLCELGGGVAVRQIEAAVAAYGVKQKTGGLLRLRKKKTAAIFGASHFSSFLAGELARKAYPLTVYCAEPDAESFLAAGALFPDPAGLRADAEALRALDIDFQFNTALTPALLASEREKYDLICLSPDLLAALFPGAAVDPETLLCPELGVLSAPVGTALVLDSAFRAKQAALTADRLAQNLDPRNSRGQEGSIETALITNVTGVVPAPRVPWGPAGYSREEARDEAARCIQCSCTECIKGCPYLRHYKKYPKLLTREIYNNVSIIMGDHMMNKPINSCALCGQCSVLCPNGYDMAEICLMARRNMVTTDKMPLAPHEFALLDQLFSNSEAFLCRPQPGFETCKYVFFPGCQAAAVAPETVKAAYLDLCRRLPGGVALMLGCCGAIAEWAGRYPLYDETAAFLDEQLAALGNPMVIAGCPTCKKMLSRNGERKLTGIWDVLEEIGLPEGVRGPLRPALLHDACGARGDAKTQAAVRRIAEKLGCELVAADYTGDEAPCCGYGGLVSYANREVAHELAQMCADRADAPQITYCMACRDRFAREGKESRHILELVYGTDAGAPPDISEKRANRLRLRQGLLREIWKEEAAEMDVGFPIEFTPEALAMMDARMILRSDVAEVLEALRETGEAVLDSETGLLVTRRRIGNVTFWVRYEERDGGYLVRGAWSHRMKIETR